jgi:hypothetical protein
MVLDVAAANMLNPCQRIRAPRPYNAIPSVAAMRLNCPYGGPKNCSACAPASRDWAVGAVLQLGSDRDLSAEASSPDFVTSASTPQSTTV